MIMVDDGEEQIMDGENVEEEEVWEELHDELHDNRMEDDNGIDAGESNGNELEGEEDSDEFNFENMVAKLEHDKRLKEQKAIQGHSKTVTRLKKYTIVQKAVSTEINPVLREDALRKVAKDASDIISSSPQRPRTPPSHQLNVHKVNSQAPTISSGPSPTIPSPKPTKLTQTTRPLASSPPNNRHSPSSFSPSSHHPSTSTSSHHHPPHSSPQSHKHNTPIDHYHYPIPTPAKDEYLQMQRSIAHLPQQARYKHEKAWLENWSKTHTTTAKQAPKASTLILDEEVANNMDNLQKVDFTPW